MIGEWEALEHIEFDNLVVNRNETFRVTQLLEDGSAIVRKDHLKTNTTVGFLETLSLKKPIP